MHLRTCALGLGMEAWVSAYDDHVRMITGGSTMKNQKTYELVLLALFTAIIVIMAFTPLGYIPLVNNTFKAATASAFVFSLVLAAGMIGISGVFKSIYICFVPRILVGVIPYFVYLLVRRLLRSERKVWCIVADRGK